MHNEQITKAIGKIKFHIPYKGNYGYRNGTASLVNSPSGPLIATAAHCIYTWRLGEFNRDVHFIPYANRKVKIKPVIAVLPKSWVEEGDLENDTAFLVIDNSQHQIIKEMFSCFDVSFGIPKGGIYEIYGFRNKLIPSYKIYKGSGTAMPDEHYGSDMQGIPCKDVGSGLSGGPWLTHYNGCYIQNSVSSTILRPYPNIIWGPFWDAEAKNAYEYASGTATDETGLSIYNYN